MTKSRNSTFRLKFVQAWTDREGRAHYYFRRAGYPRIRLPGLIGSAEFMEAYQRALGSAPDPIGAGKRSPAGSINAAIASYYESRSFKELAPSSQIVRKAVLEAFRREHGGLQIAAMPRKFIRALLDGMTPSAARNMFKAIKALIRHCIDDLELLKDDPTLGIKLRPIKSDGHHSWTEEEIAQFERYHPVGSRERLALALALYTGQRRSDVIRMGRQHVHNGWLYVTQQKTRTPQKIPVHPALARGSTLRRATISHFW